MMATVSCQGKTLWTPEETSILIEMWGNVPCLWNYKHPNYFKKELRKSETNKLAETFSCSANDVTRKLANLRTYYNREVSKSRLSATDGSNAGNYLSKWPFFDQLDNILGEQCVHRKTSTTWDLDQGSDMENFDATSDSPPDMHNDHSSSNMLESSSRVMSPSPSTSGADSHVDCKRFSKRVLPEYNFLMEATAALTAAKQQCTPISIEDEFDVYGRYIANELRAIKDEARRDYIKYKFGQILYEVKLGNSTV